MKKEFNLSEKIEANFKQFKEDLKNNNIPLRNCYMDFKEVVEEDVKEFIKRRIERTKMIIKMYPHKSGEELAGQLNEDLINDAEDKLI